MPNSDSGRPAEPLNPPPDLDRMARAYRWLEYASFGPYLARCRNARLSELSGARRALVLGDGDGRFLARWLQANRALRADAVDASAMMLRLLAARVAALGASARLRVIHADARTLQLPSGTTYDTVVTHYFLDFLSDAELARALDRIAPALAPHARWVVSEFAIPEGPMRVPSRLVVGGLYRAFGLLTGLRPRRLPDYPSALRHVGFRLESTRAWLGGLLRSELWRREF